MKAFRGSKEQGFSLVELMVVVGIIGILATLAMPRFKQFQAKAKMSEAKTMLGHIYSLEQAYYLDQNQYKDMAAMGADLTKVVGCTSVTNDIGFSIEPCDGNSPVPRYQYAVTGATAAPTTFLASAVTGTNTLNRICPATTQPAHFYVTDEKNSIGSNINAPVATSTEKGIGILCPN